MKKQDYHAATSRRRRRSRFGACNVCASESPLLELLKALLQWI